ncbi:hypothetical protein [Amycolatopsis sp. cmx-4-61]|uniref:hypothetical protein n=1 Tax=Amycolatopsis sp. cmx-4-61 TaxID=2790937 RepID=UPI00397BAD69
MHELVNLTDAERRRYIHDFVDDTFGGADANPAMVELLRSSMPELSEDATPAQVEAWMELVELVQDSGFRTADSGPRCAGWPRTRRPSAPTATPPACTTT